MSVGSPTAGTWFSSQRRPDNEFETDRVVGEPVPIVAIGMAARDAEDPLPQQIRQRVADLAGLPVVDQTVGEPLDQPVLSLRRLQQNGSAIGSRMRLIERRDDRLREQIREQDSLWYRLGVQASASVVAKGLSAQPLCHTEAFVFSGDAACS